MVSSSGSFSIGGFSTCFTRMSVAPQFRSQVCRVVKATVPSIPGKAHGEVRNCGIQQLIRTKEPFQCLRMP